MPRSLVSRIDPERRDRRRAGRIGRPALLAIAVTVPLSQLGHMLAYVLHYGAAAWPRQSFGDHAYFPLVVKTSAGLVGLLVLAALATVGLARLMRARRSADVTPRSVRGRDLLVLLLPLQLAIFTTQEAVELTLAGQLHSLSDVPLLWGLAGQLPVACLAAVFLRWGAVAVPRAIHRLTLWLELAAEPPPLATLVPAPSAGAVGPHPTGAGPMAGRKRGPPEPSPST
jgi:hypothetical protein